VAVHERSELEWRQREAGAACAMSKRELAFVGSFSLFLSFGEAKERKRLNSLQMCINIKRRAVYKKSSSAINSFSFSLMKKKQKIKKRSSANTQAGKAPATFSGHRATLN
jgi:hypothetical protein